MTTRRRLVVSSAVSLSMGLMLIACGPDQVGGWDPAPSGSDVLPTPELIAAMPGIVDPNVPKVIGTEVLPSGNTGTGVTVTCMIPEAVEQPVLFLPDTKIALWEDDEQICLGRGTDLGVQHCRWVQGHEARYRAVAECHKQALLALDTLGDDATANTRESWAEMKRRYVPGAWAMSPQDAVADVGHHEGWIALMMDGVQPAVPADPFCFNKGREDNARVAKSSVLFAMWWLWQTRQAKQDWVLGSLKRGVNVLVNPEVPALQVTVKVIDTPSPSRIDEQCSFSLPPQP